MSGFACILADPPWNFRTWSKRGRGRSADRHYRVMALERIKAMNIPAKKNAVLFMWATWPNLLDALQVIESWGFTYKTLGFVWMKQTKTGKLHWGLGYWTRANSEFCLLATRGNPRRKRADVHQVIIEPVREHSRKPDCIYERIEQLVPGPYLELFSRRRRRGWTSKGDEVGKFA